MATAEATMTTKQKGERKLPDGTVSADEMQEYFVKAGAVKAAGTGGKNCPADFQKGIAISMWQNSGSNDQQTNWDQFASQRKMLGLKSNISDGTQNLKTSDFWNRYEEDIKNAQSLGIKAFRLSIEWHRLEPIEGMVDLSAVNRYHAILDCIEAHGMVPSATLHHFVHPLWWHKKGAFEKEKNLPAFVAYCALAAKHFGPRVTLWCTFNEPTCALVCGYIIGAHPPGKTLALRLAGKVLLNMLRCHTMAYKAMKAVPGCANIEIGLVHHQIEFMPVDKAHWWIKRLSWWTTYWWGRDTVPNYFKTGTFEWRTPFGGRTINYTEPGGRPPVDWWGINYYSRGVIAPQFMPAQPEGETETDMGYNVYPTSMYENIVRMSQLGVPMYITETGAADKSAGGVPRKQCVESYIGQALKAIRDGYDVRGFYYWTLVDNFEWNTGHSMRFGLYEWNQDGSADRVQRDGALTLKKMYADLPENMDDLRAYLKENFHESKYTLDLLHEQMFTKPMPIAWNKGRYVDCKPNNPLHLRIGWDDVEELEGDHPCRRIPLYIVSTLAVVSGVLLYPRVFKFSKRVFREARKMIPA